MDVSNLEPPNGKNELGQFVAGNKFAVGQKPYQRYADRAITLQQDLTPERLMELVNNPKELNKRSVLDVQIIKRLARTLADVTPMTCSDVRQELEAHLDRMEGKSQQTIPVDGNASVVVQIIQYSTNGSEKDLVDVKP